MQDKELVNFGEDEYDIARIKASASNVKQLVSRMQSANRAKTRR